MKCVFTATHMSMYHPNTIKWQANQSRTGVRIASSNEIHPFPPLRRACPHQPVVVPRPPDDPHPFVAGERLIQGVGVPDRDDLVSLRPDHRAPPRERFEGFR